jgi:tetratricopeptide (TPR) repeat protein
VLAVLLLSGSSGASGRASLERGQAAERAGQRQAALEAYTDAIMSGDLTPAQRAFAHYRRGGIHGFLGNNVDGIAEYTRALELDPKLGGAFSLRAYLRGVIGQYDQAEEDHRRAIELAKDQTWQGYLSWVQQHYADLFRRRRAFDKALQYCDEAIAKSYAPAFLRRAWVYLDMGRTTDAKADFQRFEAEMQRQGTSYDIFWPDERGAISRLRELR